MTAKQTQTLDRLLLQAKLRPGLPRFMKKLPAFLSKKQQWDLFLDLGPDQSPWRIVLVADPSGCTSLLTDSHPVTLSTSVLGKLNASIAYLMKQQVFGEYTVRVVGHHNGWTFNSRYEPVPPSMILRGTGIIAVILAELMHPANITELRELCF